MLCKNDLCRSWNNEHITNKMLNFSEVMKTLLLYLIYLVIAHNIMIENYFSLNYFISIAKYPINVLMLLISK